MKKVLLFVLSLGLLFTSCEKGGLVLPDADTDGMLKSAEVKMLPFKADIQSTIIEYNEGVPVSGFLSGTMSHLGKLNAEKSIWYTSALSFDENTGTITWEAFGDSYAANGDIMHYLFSGSLNLPTNTLTAYVDIDGGTGRFEFADGYMDITGYADDPTAITTVHMEGEGFISSVGSSK